MVAIQVIMLIGLIGFQKEQDVLIIYLDNREQLFFSGQQTIQKNIFIGIIKLLEELLDINQVMIVIIYLILIMMDNTL